MAIIKSYTDIAQSKKLAEILPIESADMFYIAGKGKPIFIGNKMVACGNDDYDALGEPDVLCWSLAALLGVLPNDISLLYFDDTYQMVYDKKPYVISNKFDNPVDACIDTIIKLKERNII